jgi:restriction endonuclease Mrr
MIPSRKEAKPVILDFLSEGSQRSSEQVQELIATHFALTDDERTRKRGRGPHPEYVNETAWALVDLQKDGLIKKTDLDSFVYRITDSGRHAAQNRSLGTPIPSRHARQPTRQL